MTDEQAAELIERMDLLVRLTAISLTADRPNRDSIRLLSFAGLQPKQIANLLGTSRNTVSVELTRQKKLKRKA